MAMSNSSQSGMMSEINVTPLVDVMLVLLVVFIVTAPLLTPQSLKVNVPTTKAVTATDEKKLLPSHLVVDEKGNALLDSVPVTDTQLADILKQKAVDPLFIMKIEADKTVPYGRVAEFMAIAQHAGVTSLSFVTISGR
uniref:Biopolymer transport protein ExbD n=1 Tax=Candidatus Nitrotoga fabula TaxID=2182327 RepID=A0A2X0SNG2_9PROT|nr:Biopolymer transport protein ExbD [Candidatus Nitrotoga fabula]